MQHGGRKKFKELRQKLQTDDEDCQTSNLTPPNSQTSSIEGLYAAPSRTTHPFRVIEVDALSLQSLNSLGRLGRILGGLTDNGRYSCLLLFIGIIWFFFSVRYARCD